MNEVVFEIETELDGGYNARAIGHSIFTEGETLLEVKNNISDAVKCHFDDDMFPIRIQLKIVQQESFELA